MTHNDEVIDLIVLYGAQAAMQLEARQHDHAVALVHAAVAHHHECVDVAEWEQAQGVLLVVGPLGISVMAVKGVELHRVGNDVAVADHDALGESARPARVAQERNARSAAITTQPQRLQRLAARLSRGYEVFDGLEAGG